jgi:hypothetical protein
MALDATFLTLRDRIGRLTELLAAVRSRLGDGCPDDTHCLYSRINDAVPVVEGWLRKAAKAVRVGAAAAARSDAAAARQALTRCEHAFGKARLECGRELTSRGRAADLADLGKRRRKVWGEWAKDVSDALADVRRQAAAACAALAACWRELAAHPAPGVVVNNVAIGKKVTGRSRPRAGFAANERGDN